MLYLFHNHCFCLRICTERIVSIFRFAFITIVFTLAIAFARFGLRVWHTWVDMTYIMHVIEFVGGIKWLIYTLMTDLTFSTRRHRKHILALYLHLFHPSTGHAHPPPAPSLSSALTHSLTASEFDLFYSHSFCIRSDHLLFFCGALHFNIKPGKSNLFFLNGFQYCAIC